MSTAGEWRAVTLDQLGRIVTGKTPSSSRSDYFGGDIPFVTPTDFDGRRIIGTTGRYLTEQGVDSISGSRIPARSVMVSCIGSDMGKAAIAGRDCVTNQQINSIVVESGDDPLFVYYNLSTRKTEVRTAAGGSAQPILNKSAFGRLDISLPPPSEQRVIAHILGTLDDKIELNRRMNETLEAMARALFKSWFVDFDPVRAKAASGPTHAKGRTSEASRAPDSARGPRLDPIGEAERRAGQDVPMSDERHGGRDSRPTDPGLPKPLADLFPDSFEDSELGEIPKGWEIATLSDFAALNPETWSKETRPSVINYVDLSNTKWGRIEEVTVYTQKEAPSRAQRVLRPQDTIVGTVRPGNGSYAFISQDGLTGSTGFAVLRPLKVEYAEFVYLAATNADNTDRLAHLADGAAYPAVRPEVVAATQTLKTPDGVIERFSRIADPLLAKIAGNERESRTLAALRDTLLPELISGELRINSIERIPEAV